MGRRRYPVPSPPQRPDETPRRYVCGHCCQLPDGTFTKGSCCVCLGRGHITLAKLLANTSVWARPGCLCLACAALRRFERNMLRDDTKKKTPPTP
jgi:hypothetical protein